MKNIFEYKGYTAMQSGYNNHVSVFTNGICVGHMNIGEPLTEAEMRELVDEFIVMRERIQKEKCDAQRKTWPPYMDNPRNACAGCVHEETNRGSFPCDECKRMLKGEHDMFVEKVKE